MSSVKEFIPIPLYKGIPKHELRKICLALISKKTNEPIIHKKKISNSNRLNDSCKISRSVQEISNGLKQKRNKQFWLTVNFDSKSQPTRITSGKQVPPISVDIKSRLESKKISDKKQKVLEKESSILEQYIKRLKKGFNSNEKSINDRNIKGLTRLCSLNDSEASVRKVCTDEALHHDEEHMKRRIITPSFSEKFSVKFSTNHSDTNEGNYLEEPNHEKPTSQMSDRNWREHNMGQEIINKSISSKKFRNNDNKSKDIFLTLSAEDKKNVRNSLQLTKDSAEEDNKKSNLLHNQNKFGETAKEAKNIRSDVPLLFKKVRKILQGVSAIPIRASASDSSVFNKQNHNTINVVEINKSNTTIPSMEKLQKSLSLNYLQTKCHYSPEFKKRCTNRLENKTDSEYEVVKKKVSMNIPLNSVIDFCRNLKREKKIDKMDLRYMKRKSPVELIGPIFSGALKTKKKTSEKFEKNLKKPLYTINNENNSVFKLNNDSKGKLNEIRKFKKLIDTTSGMEEVRQKNNYAYKSNEHNKKAVSDKDKNYNGLAKLNNQNHINHYGSNLRVNGFGFRLNDNANLSKENNFKRTTEENFGLLPNEQQKHKIWRNINSKSASNKLQKCVITPTVSSRKKNTEINSINLNKNNQILKFHRKNINDRDESSIINKNIKVGNHYLDSTGVWKKRSHANGLAYSQLSEKSNFSSNDDATLGSGIARETKIKPSRIVSVNDQVIFETSKKKISKNNESFGNKLKMLSKTNNENFINNKKGKIADHHLNLNKYKKTIKCSASEHFIRKADGDKKNIQNQDKNNTKILRPLKYSNNNQLKNQKGKSVGGNVSVSTGDSLTLKIKSNLEDKVVSTLNSSKTGQSKSLKQIIKSLDEKKLSKILKHPKSNFGLEIATNMSEKNIHYIKSAVRSKPSRLHLQHRVSHEFTPQFKSKDIISRSNEKIDEDRISLRKTLSYSDKMKIQQTKGGSQIFNTGITNFFKEKGSEFPNHNTDKRLLARNSLSQPLINRNHLNYDYRYPENNITYELKSRGGRFKKKSDLMTASEKSKNLQNENSYKLPVQKKKSFTRGVDSRKGKYEERKIHKTKKLELRNFFPEKFIPLKERYLLTKDGKLVPHGELFLENDTWAIDSENKKQIISLESKNKLEIRASDVKLKLRGKKLPVQQINYSKSLLQYSDKLNFQERKFQSDQNKIIAVYKDKIWKNGQTNTKTRPKLQNKMKESIQNKNQKSIHHRKDFPKAQSDADLTVSSELARTNKNKQYLNNYKITKFETTFPNTARQLNTLWKNRKSIKDYFIEDKDKYDVYNLYLQYRISDNEMYLKKNKPTCGMNNKENRIFDNEFRQIESIKPSDYDGKSGKVFNYLHEPSKSLRANKSKSTRRTTKLF